MGTLLATKFYVPPPPPSFVARSQLIGKLDEALRQRLTLVSAAPGSGKTTLISGWVPLLRKKGAAVGWLSLDESDNDLHTFLQYLLACLEEGGVCIDAAEACSGDGPRSEDVLAGIVGAVLPLRREAVLILDDYHVIHAPAVHSAVAYLVDHAPPRLHLVLLTRVDPPFELARLRVSGQLVELRMDDLRFAPPEAGEFLGKAAGLRLDPADVAALTERTEGWIAGLQMAAISMRGRSDPSAFIRDFTGSHRFVFDYLLEQVLDRQRPECRDFLLKTSILDQFCAPLCDAVAETHGSARTLLESLVRANLFLEPLDDERQWYRYHRLLSDLLRIMLDQTYPGLKAELHRRACLWFEAEGLPCESLRHALAAGDMELAAHIVSSNVLLMLENDDAVAALQQLEAVPAHEMVARPWLGIARAWALGAAQVGKSQEILDGVEQALEALPEGEERRRMTGHLAAARASLYAVVGDQRNVIAQASRAVELLPEDEQAVRALALLIWGDVRADDRKHDPDAIGMLEEGLALCTRLGKPHGIVMAAGALASANLHVGRFQEMERVCRQGIEVAEEYERRTGRPLAAAANLYALAARVLAEWGRNEEAVQLARRALMMSERWGQLDTEVLCLNYLARALAFANDAEQCRRVSQRARDLSERISPWWYQITVVFCFDTLLDIENADLGELEQQKRLVEQTGARYTELFMGRLLLRQHRADEALALFGEALARLEPRDSFDTPRLHALRAAALYELGQEQPALEALCTALDMAEPENRVATFVREGAAMEKLLRVARSRGLSPNFIQHVLSFFDARRKQPAARFDADEPLVEPLSERELEILQHLDGPLSTPEIAEQLVVSANTVRTHIKSIYGKLGVHGRSAAVRQARLAGLLV